MIRHSLVLICVLVSAHSVADQVIDEEAEIDESNSAILRDSFTEPLYFELVKSGLAPLIAKGATNRLLDGLTECWKSELNEINGEEPAVIPVQMGGQIIVTYKTPSLEAFLTAVNEAKP